MTEFRIPLGSLWVIRVGDDTLQDLSCLGEGLAIEFAGPRCQEADN